MVPNVIAAGTDSFPRLTFWSLLRRYAGAITCEDFSMSDGRVIEIRATFTPIQEGAKPPKVRQRL